MGAAAELVGAGLFVGGAIVGRVMRFTRTPKAYEPKTKPAVCSCSHAYSFHDPKTGVCHSTVRLQTSKGEPILSPGRSFVVAHSGAKFENVQCSCRVYDGPQPLPDYYAPELSL